MNTDTTPTTKDTVKIVYLDVSFQGHEEGRLALRSRSMTFFDASGDRKGNIAWTAISRIQTGAVKNATEEKFMLKIINKAGQSLTFSMKNEDDLDGIRNDIQTLMKAYKEKRHNASASNNQDASALCLPDQKPAPIELQEHDSLTCFPRFVDEGSCATRSIITNKSTATRSVGTKHTSVAGQSMRGDEVSVLSRQSRRSGTSTSTSRSMHLQSNEIQGEIMVDEDLSDDPTIASSVMTGVTEDPSHSNSPDDVDVEAATRSSKRSVTSAPTKTFKEEDYPLPVASFRLVPETTTNVYAYDPAKQVLEPRRTKFWRFKWFWIALALIALLLLGFGAGAAMNSSRNKSSNTVVAGLEDSETTTTTLEPTTLAVETNTPTPSPSEAVIVQAALERTSEPTNLPTPSPTTADPCSAVLHNTAINDRNSAIDAGSYGGSAYCRANILSMCEGTTWVPFNSYQGTGTAWFTAIAFEDSFCVADIEHQVKLTVPSGVDYDLHVYNADSNIPHDSSQTVGSDTNKVVEQVVISGEDETLSDQSFVYYIQVEYKSGSSCEPWTLEIYGHQCL